MPAFFIYLPLYRRSAGDHLFMRYAFISDIHANLTALQSVLNDISRLKVDKIICLGDTAGYGPQPAETLELIYQVAEVHLLGNHDAAICGKLNPVIFSDSARKAVLKHREMISSQALQWLETLHLTFKGPGFQCAHGDFSKPGAFNYIISEADTLPSWDATQEQLLFVGHTHLAAIHVIGASGLPHYLPPCDFILEKGKRYIINPGTVGYPRSGTFESTYCIYDSVEKSVVFYRLPFDYIAYNRSLAAAGFDEIPWATQRASALSLPEVRKRLSFTKPLADEDHVIESLKKIQSSQQQLIKKYRFLVTLVVLLSIAGGFYLIRRIIETRAAASVTLTVPEGQMQAINAYPLKAGGGNFLHKLPPALNSGDPLPGWRYIFENKEEQHASAGASIAGNQLLVAHSGHYKFVLESPLVNLAGTGLDAVRIRGRIRKLAGFEGHVFYQLHTYVQDKEGTLHRAKVDSFEVRGRSNEGADAAAISRKIKLIKEASHLRLRIEADFTGAVELRQPELVEEDSTISAAAEGNIP
ncbi:MAG: metallophosphoesterase family protein [Kiritimatiellia bacterium]